MRCILLKVDKLIEKLTKNTCRILYQIIKECDGQTNSTTILPCTPSIPI